MEITFELKTAGYCLAGQHHSLRGAPRKMIKFPATYGLLNHPDQGYILFDTGYTRRFHHLTEKYPNRLYAKMTEVFVTAEEEAVDVLLQQGIAPEEVKYIIISHFHADHVGGLKDFPKAQFICSENAYTHLISNNNWAAVFSGYLPKLIPNDFGQRCQLISFKNSPHQDPHLGPLVDLFGDQSLWLCSFEGHARGQLGLLFESEGKRWLLAADAAWSEKAYQEYHLPHPIVRLLFDSWSDYKQSLKKLHKFHQANPETIIIPCHCEHTRLCYEI